MNPNQTNPEPDYTQPVAYDSDGRPLYHHPPAAVTPSPVTTAPPIEPQPTSHVTIQPEMIEGQNFNPQIRAQYANEPNVVHAARPLEPTVPAVSPETKAHHDQSVRDYPQLNLSEGEYVILDIKRHPIGMVIPTAITLLLVVVLLVFAASFSSLTANIPLFPAVNPGAVLGIALLLVALVVLGGAITLWVYLQNHFFMTNESVIQEIQQSLFVRHEQTVSLGSIEDASFFQAGIAQTIFNYGTIRLSTEGEETTYIFHYVANPKHQVAILNNAIEAFKNGRPVCYD